uniref:Fe2OG dioxygenase domain-containing protein n=1 Tax=Lotharella globosa TaxID=91324 RepID=A0A7S3YRP1_9EUKA
MMIGFACLAFTGTALALGSASLASEERRGVTFTTISLDAYLRGSPQAKLRIAQDLDEALQTAGFFYLVDHGVPLSVTEGILNATSAFFELPEEDKRAAQQKEKFGDLGYADNSLDDAEGKNGKAEYFNYHYTEGADMDESERKLPTPLKGKLSTWASAAKDVAIRIHQIASLALAATDPSFEASGGSVSDAEHLLERHFFDQENTTRYSVRLNYYGDLSREVQEGSQNDDSTLIRLGGHYDFILFTVNHANDVGGLQLRMDDGEWVDVPARPDAMLINSGLINQHVSNGRWRAPRHRVTATTLERRVSVPLFPEPHPKALMEPLPGCHACQAAPPKYRKITVEEHMKKMFSDPFNEGNNNLYNI